ncbi:MAG: hypothetical protein AAFQ98_18050, partial [Bacteroidota bacterium]
TMRNFTIALFSLVLFLTVGTTSVFAQSNDESTTESIERPKPAPGSTRIVSFRRQIPDYGYHGHQYTPHQINRDLVKAFGDFAPYRPKPLFNGAVVEAVSRFSGNHTKRTRRQRFRQFKKNNNFSGFANAKYFVSVPR